jgi:hypothetical protein
VTDIIIYTTPEKLLHKQGKLKDDSDYSPSGKYYWYLSRSPKRLVEGDKVWFATKGFVRGGFIVEELEEYSPSGTNIIFNCSTWEDLTEDYEIKSFQGFKYVDVDCEVFK